MQIEKYIADKITSLCEKRDISKYRLSQLSGISQPSLGRIIAQENLPSLITLEKNMYSIRRDIITVFSGRQFRESDRKTERSFKDMEQSEYK